MTSTFVPGYLFWNLVMTLLTQFRYADPGVDVVSTPPSHSWIVPDLAPLLDELLPLLHAVTANNPASARTSRVRNLVTGPRARLLLLVIAALTFMAIQFSRFFRKLLEPAELACVPYRRVADDLSVAND